MVIQRLGPFTLTGSYDWIRIGHPNAFEMNDTILDLHVIGGGFFPIDGKTNQVIGYPPIHIHHAHLYAYGDIEERFNKTLNRYQDKSDSHHVLIQAHGDSECKPEQGGVSCLWNELENSDTEGYFVSDDHSGFTMDFDLNNVGDKLIDDVYMEVAIVYKDGDPIKRVTYTHSGNGCFGNGPCTYDMPYEGNTNIMWHTFTSPFRGTVYDFHLHTHQTMVDSVYLFKNDNVYHFLEAFRGQKQYLPIIFECGSWRFDSIDELKDNIFKYFLDDIICRVDTPSLYNDHDKRMNLHCLKNVKLGRGDKMTVVAFNRVTPNKYHRNDTQLMKNIQGTQFAAKQHTIFRFNVRHILKSTKPTDNPPAFYDYANITKELRPFNPPGAHDKIVQNCKIKF